MNTTIAVAMITALSTLAAATATGYLALLVNRTQQRSAELDRIEKRAQYIREARRDIYLAFMRYLNQMEEMFDRDLWIRAGAGEASASPGEIMYTATAGMNRLSLHLDLLRLEWPDKVGDAGLKLYSVLDDEMKRLIAFSSGVRDGVLPEDGKHILWKGTAQARREAKDEFIRVSREALEELIS